MSRCSVCAHQARLGIEAALVAGTSRRATAREFGTTEAALRRHEAHLRRASAQATHPSDAATNAPLPSGVAALLRAASADLVPGPLVLPSGLVPNPSQYALGWGVEILIGDRTQAVEKLVELRDAWRSKLEAVLHAP